MLQQNTTKRVGYWFVYLHHRFEEGTAAALREEKLSRRQWQVLHALAIGVDTVEGLDEAFAPFLPLDGVPGYQPIVAELAERGWATEEDGTIRLTEAGRAAHGRAEVLVEAHAAKSLRGIGEEEFLAANAVLRRIAENLDS
ncbi:MarR family winged helix-turn-helix transcriptional regulator [Amycolatopsis sp. NPDC049868]|uniref:MarR family winged helix-turn-helix transcriptional regulator n=1 Tax=Amycolatopsis sp. NPDC049868 TaxID=3363934 RepID=UPI0037BAD300